MWWYALGHCPFGAIFTRVFTSCLMLLYYFHIKFVPHNTISVVNFTSPSCIWKLSLRISHTCGGPNSLPDILADFFFSPIISYKVAVCLRCASTGVIHKCGSVYLKWCQLPIRSFQCYYSTSSSSGLS